MPPNLPLGAGTKSVGGGACQGDTDTATAAPGPNGARYGAHRETDLARHAGCRKRSVHVVQIATAIILQWRPPVLQNHSCQPRFAGRVGSGGRCVVDAFLFTTRLWPLTGPNFLYIERPLGHIVFATATAHVDFVTVRAPPHRRR